MYKYAILVTYVGMDYCGWQRQKLATGDLASIQLSLERAIAQMTGEGVSVTGSGRTDSGVHAAGQVAHFTLTKKEWTCPILKRGLNGILPRSIRVAGVCRVSARFHSQKSAVKKQYSYYFQQGPCPIPHLEPLSWWISKTLNLDAMSEALRSLVGEFDFKPFQGSGSKPGPTIRTLFEADVTSVPIPFPLTGFGNDPSFSLVRVRVVGSGFLKQMVRGIAGTLLQVGEQRRPHTCMAEILATQNRAAVGPTAPARALWLEKVWYPETDELRVAF